MVQTAQILGNIDHITEELSELKKALLYLEMGKSDRSKGAWERIKKASQKVSWDGITAVDEIRMQREKKMKEILTIDSSVFVAAFSCRVGTAYQKS